MMNPGELTLLTLSHGWTLTLWDSPDTNSETFGRKLGYVDRGDILLIIGCHFNTYDEIPWVLVLGSSTVGWVYSQHLKNVIVESNQLVLNGI